MLKVAIIIGSTRPGRKAEAVAHWVHDIAAKLSDASFEVVDIASFHLPLLDEALPPRWASMHSRTRKPGPGELSRLHDCAGRLSDNFEASIRNAHVPRAECIHKTTRDTG